MSQSLLECCLRIWAASKEKEQCCKIAARGDTTKSYAKTIENVGLLNMSAHANPVSVGSNMEMCLVVSYPPFATNARRYQQFCESLKMHKGLPHQVPELPNYEK